MTYTEAYEELQQIVRRMESGEVSVDALAEHVKRATELVKVCKAKLHQTEQDVQKILDDLSPEAPQAATE
ncbi:MAG: exodeoxyribonuclease small subunit [Bacteroidota bacterium]|jgi:exodeoxyribonuclease VII small subunit